jgi:hypothetical protein
MDQSDRQQPGAMRAPDSAPDDLQVKAIARRVAEAIANDPHQAAGHRLVDAATLAAELGVERSWVYEHADELHPIRLGKGPKPRLRFDALAVRAAFVSRQIIETEHCLDVDQTKRRTQPRAQARSRSERVVGKVLAVRPRGTS